MDNSSKQGQRLHGAKAIQDWKMGTGKMWQGKKRWNMMRKGLCSTSSKVFSDWIFMKGSVRSRDCCPFRPEKPL